MSTINLLPDNYAQRRTRRRATMLCLVLFSVVVAGVLTTWTVSNRNHGHTRRTLERINADYTEATKLIKQMQQLESQRSRMQAKARKAAALVERVPRSTILAVLTNALPKHTSLAKLEMDVEKSVRVAAARKETKFAALSKSHRAAATTSEVVLRITGLASTDVEVARYIANLSRHPLIRAVDLEYSEAKTYRDYKVREFKLVVKLNSQIDAMDALQTADATAKTAGTRRVRLPRGDKP